MRLRGRLLAACAVAGLVAACASGGVDPRILGDSGSQASLRSIQSREFDSGETAKTLKTVTATLQDLGFVLDRVDEGLGVTSGTKVMSAASRPSSSGVLAAMLVGGGRGAAGPPGKDSALRITVTVQAKGPNRVLVRANAELDQRTIRDPQQYQEFFAALEKAMFLTAHQVD
jgi:hypothetical protein